MDLRGYLEPKLVNINGFKTGDPLVAAVVLASVGVCVPLRGIYALRKVKSLFFVNLSLSVLKVGLSEKKSLCSDGVPLSGSRSYASDVLTLMASKLIKRYLV